MSVLITDAGNSISIDITENIPENRPTYKKGERFVPKSFVCFNTSEEGTNYIYISDRDTRFKFEESLVTTPSGTVTEKVKAINALRDIGAIIAIGSSYHDSIIQGLVPGKTYVNGGGDNPSLSINTESTLWPVLDTIYEFLSAATVLKISSSSALDTTQTIVVNEGLDGDWNPITPVAALNGQNKVDLSAALLRINAVLNLGGTLAGDVYIYEDTAIVAGVPTDKTKIKAVIPFDSVRAVGFQSANASNMAVYSVKEGHNGLVQFQRFFAGKNVEARTFPTFRLFGDTKFISPLPVGSYQNSFQLNTPFLVPPKTDIMWNAISPNNNTDMAMSFEIILSEI